LPRWLSRQALPAPPAQAAGAGHTEHLPCHGFRGARRSTASTPAASATAAGLTMKLVGKPDAGNRHVRFDERGQETECCHMAQATAPVLASTRRREVITLVGGATAAWPRAARGQQALPMIGFLNAASAEQWAPFVSAFRLGLGETGYTEGNNVTIEFHWANEQYDRLPALAVDLVRRQPTVIVANHVSAPAPKPPPVTIPTAFTTSLA